MHLWGPTCCTDCGMVALKSSVWRERGRKPARGKQAGASQACDPDAQVGVGVAWAARHSLHGQAASAPPPPLQDALDSIAKKARRRRPVAPSLPLHPPTQNLLDGGAEAHLQQLVGLVQHLGGGGRGEGGAWWGESDDANEVSASLVVPTSPTSPKHFTSPPPPRPPAPPTSVRMPWSLAASPLFSRWSMRRPGVATSTSQRPDSRLRSLRGRQGVQGGGVRAGSRRRGGDTRTSQRPASPAPPRLPACSTC